MSAPWKHLLQQSLRKNEKLRHAKYFQIATTKVDGRPSNRTVVFRGFLWDTDRLTFVTDARSSKIEELAASPWAEVAWYFSDTREQYRLLGQVTIVSSIGPDDEKLQRARVSAWKNMSDPGRQQFMWPHPGLPRLEENAGGSEDEALFNPQAPGKEDPVAEPFCLCYIEVEEVDHLSLKTNQRRTYKRQGENWIGSFVNP